jgi:glycosyltransferase involved in cell wall biosynthesis
MRLAILHNQPGGGARRTLYQFGKRLSARHELDVYTLASADETTWPSADVAARVDVTPFTRRPQRALGFYLNDVRAWQDLNDLDATWHRVADRVNNGGYDAALVDVDRWIGAPFVLRYLRIPHIYYCHEPPRRYTEPMCRPEALPLTRWERLRLIWRMPTTRLLDAWTQRAEWINVRAAQRIVTNSAYNQHRIHQVYGRTAELCSLGVDSAFFTPAECAETREILSVGALEPHKGFEFLLRALARSRTRPALRIVGGGGHPRMAAHLGHLAQHLGIALTIEQGISDAVLRERYRQAALVACTAHLEPFGLTPIEAMACGRAVLAIAEGGLRESVVPGVTGILVPRDEARFAAAIDELLTDNARRRELGINGRATVLEHWTWETAAERLERQLCAVANEPSDFGVLRSSRSAVVQQRRMPPSPTSPAAKGR